MQIQILCFGEYRQGNLESDSYALYHQSDRDRDTSPHILERISIDYLGGYIEGACFGRWNSTDLVNGIPKNYRKHFTGNPQPLSKEKLEKLLGEITDLKALFPNLR